MIEIAEFNLDGARAAYESPGGFVWWYVDLVDGFGNGAVVIWSFGLPFLSGSRHLPEARHRPALNVATYRRGRPDFYLLQEYPQGQVDIDLATGAGRLGKTTFDVSESESHVRLLVDLDLEVPHQAQRVKGRLTLSGARPALPDSSGASHTWTPRTTLATGNMTLEGEGEHFLLQGRGYFDSNFSRQPLHQQSIESWCWGRVGFEDETLVFYDIQMEDDSVRRHLFRQGGPSRRDLMRLSVDSFHSSDFRRSTYGVRSPRTFTIDTPLGDYRVSAVGLVDDSPFYQRFLLTGTRPDGEEGYGVSEVVVPARLDRPWQRPFVRMRTHAVGKENSPFLPLFTGARDSRISRLARTFAFFGGGS